MGRVEPLRLSVGLRTLMVEHARGEAPREACGLLLGRGRHVLFVSPVENSNPNPEHHYSISRDAVAATVRRAGNLGVEIVGGWHSHPGGPPELSGRDLRALPPDVGPYLQVLITPTDGQVRAWVIMAQHATEIPVASRHG